MLQPSHDRDLARRRRGFRFRPIDSRVHLLEAIESCSELFSRYGGHAHACGFAMPAANVLELRARLDAFARARLTLADFEPALAIDGELPLEQISPTSFRRCVCSNPTE